MMVPPRQASAPIIVDLDGDYIISTRFEENRPWESCNGVSMAGCLNTAPADRELARRQEEAHALAARTRALPLFGPIRPNTNNNSARSPRPNERNFMPRWEPCASEGF